MSAPEVLTFWFIGKPSITGLRKSCPSLGKNRFTAHLQSDAHPVRREQLLSFSSFKFICAGSREV